MSLKGIVISAALVVAAFMGGRVYTVNQIADALTHGKAVQFGEVVVQPTEVIQQKTAAIQGTCDFCHGTSGPSSGIAEAAQR